MESTGSFWKPIYNLLKLEDIEVLVVNAQHIKNVPGRKTDVKDAEWIAGLLRHGLLKGSSIPNRDQRELRELIRYRRSLIEEHAREVSRIQKVLEVANIKLSSVASNVLGKSGSAMIEAMIAPHLCSWAGLCPDQNESAGKRKREVIIRQSIRKLESLGVSVTVYAAAS